LGGFYEITKKLTGAISLIAMITSATAVIGQEIKVWTTETQPARLERQAKMAAEYEASTGVKLK
jgi:ABC-type glycerol-3-phosphate transport system substrate-binding protein